MKAFLASYPAIVRDVHDPQRSGRIKVECPPLFGSDWSPWCLPKHASHLWSVPYEGETVWISLRQGNPRYPVWEGRYTTFSETSAPAEFRALAQGPYKDELRDAVDHQNRYDDADHARGHDHGAGEFWNPYVHGLFFPMGSALYTDEEPGEQGVTLRDRVGQYLRLAGDPTEPLDPHDETRVGGEYDAPDLDDGSTLYADTGFRAVTRLQGRHTQFLELRVKDADGEQEAELRSMDIGGSDGGHLTISGGELSHHSLLEWTAAGRVQGHDLNVDPNNLTVDYQRLYDSNGQSIQINGNAQSPDRFIELKNATGEKMKMEQDQKKITIEDRLGTMIQWDVDANTIRVQHHSGDHVTMNGITVTAMHKSGSLFEAGAGFALLANNGSEQILLGAAGTAVTTKLMTVNGRPVALMSDQVITPMGPGSVIASGA